MGCRQSSIAWSELSACDYTTNAITGANQKSNVIISKTLKIIIAQSAIFTQVSPVQQQSRNFKLIQKFSIPIFYLRFWQDKRKIVSILTEKIERKLHDTSEYSSKCGKSKLDESVWVFGLSYVWVNEVVTWMQFYFIRVTSMFE